MLREVSMRMFKFNREREKRFERAKANSKLHVSTGLESLRRAPTWRLHTKPYNFQ